MSTSPPCSGFRWLWILILAGSMPGCIREVAGPRPARYRLRSGPSEIQKAASALRGAQHAAGPRALNQDEFPGGYQSSADEDLFLQPFDVVRTELPPEILGTRRHDKWDLDMGDGQTTTQFFLVRSESPGAEVVAKLLTRFIPEFAALEKDRDWWTVPLYLKESRNTSDERWKQEKTAFALPLGNPRASDLLAVNGTPELLSQVSEFLENIVAGAPQVELETRIVEIVIDDDLLYGIRANVSRGTPKDPESNLFDNLAIELAQDLVEGTVGHFSAIHDETVITGLMEFLQKSRNSEVLSFPKLAVLNGHRAVIDTGSEVPILQPNFNAIGITSVSTRFQPTGIRVIITPFVLTPEMVQLDIAVEVSTVTGFVTAGLGGGESIENPLISRRNAYTVVNVPTGKTVLFGGLVASEDQESIDKVPILGDIPLIGYLFKRTSISKRNAQVLFSITPTVMHHGLSFEDTERSKYRMD